MKIVANIELGERGHREAYMPKILAGSKVWAGPTFYFVALFLLLGIVALAGGNALGQHQGTSPHFLHFSSNLRTNLASTTDPQSAPMTGSMLFEDAEMADITIYVSNQTELYEALNNATGGETILLAPGNYGDVALGGYTKNVGDFPTQVTIRSVDSNNPASFSGLSLQGVSNLKFDCISFDYSFTITDPIWQSPFVVSGSVAVSIENSIFKGSIATGLGLIDDGYGYARGLVVRDSEEISLVGNEFLDWHRAALFFNSDMIEIVGNNIHDIRSDGLNFAQVSNLVVSDNFIHDFRTLPESGDHADFIQFWTTNTDQPSSSVTISDNILDVGNGSGVQGIFIGNEAISTGLAGDEMFYRDFTIENNLIRVDHVHGISVGPINSLALKSNTIVAKEGSQMTPSINVASQSVDVSIIQNAIPALKGYSGQLDWTLYNNAMIQYSRPNDIGYYRDNFVESSLFSELGVSGLVVSEGSFLDTLEAGSNLASPASSTSPVRALFDVFNSSENSDTYVFDARMSFGKNGEFLPAGTEYHWTLPDGNSFLGPVLVHEFAQAGVYQVSLTVLTPDGLLARAFADIEVYGRDIVNFDPSSGQFEVTGYGESLSIDVDQSSLVPTDDGDYKLLLGSPGVASRISRFSIDHLFSAEAVTVSFSIQANTKDSVGEIFRLHSFLLAEVLDTGELRISLTTASGAVVRPIASGVILTDGDLHEVQISVDAEEGRISIVVDSVLTSSTFFTDDLPAMGSWDLTFGNEWGGRNFDGVLSAFDLDATNSDYPIFADIVIGEDLATLHSANETSSYQPGDSNDLSADPFIGDDSYPNLLFDESQFFGRVKGDVHLEQRNDVPVAVFDGFGDSIRLGLTDETTNSPKLTVGLGFSIDPSSGMKQVLFSSGNLFELQVSDDELSLLIRDGSISNTKETISVANLDLDDGEFHDLILTLDSDQGRVQLSLDDLVIADRSDINLDLAQGYNWWSKGWTVGDGGRRGMDFSGALEYMNVVCDADFVNI